MNANDWVAEHVMGFERGNCQGTTGGATGSVGGPSEIWFYCDWCGQQIYDGKTEPCPKYPFPKFTLVDLMRKLGEEGDPVMVRYDALRPRRNFTVTLHTTRVADTDDPLQSLCDYLYRHQSLYPPKGKHFVSGEQVLEEYVPSYERRRDILDWPTQEEGPSPALFANIRDAIKLLQKAVGKG